MTLSSEPTLNRLTKTELLLHIGKLQTEVEAMRKDRAHEKSDLHLQAGSMQKSAMTRREKLESCEQDLANVTKENKRLKSFALSLRREIYLESRARYSMAECIDILQKELEKQ